MEFSRQDYWSGLPFPSPEDLPNPGIELWSPALQADSLPIELQGSPWGHQHNCSLSCLCMYTGKYQLSSVAQSCPTLCDPMNCSTPGFPVHHHSWILLKLMTIQSVTPSNHLTLCRPLLLLPSIFPSIRVFSNESYLCIRWPMYWSFSFSISTSDEYSELISFRMDEFDLLTVQGILKSLFQQHSSKASILQHSAFFTVQLSHPYMTTGKTIALTR